MERVKKILISTENLERMQHQLRQNPISFVDESKEIIVPQNSDNILSTNNTGKLISREFI